MIEGGEEREAGSAQPPEGGEADPAVGQVPFSGSADFEHGWADDALHGDAVDGVEGQRSLCAAADVVRALHPGAQHHGGVGGRFLGPHVTAPTRPPHASSADHPPEPAGFNAPARPPPNTSGRTRNAQTNHVRLKSRRIGTRRCSSSNPPPVLQPLSQRRPRNRRVPRRMRMRSSTSSTHERSTVDHGTR